MVTQVKKNEAVVLPLYKNGPRLQWFTITFPSAINAKLGATTAGVRSPVVAALDAIAQRVSIEIVGEPQNSNTEISIGVVAIGGDHAEEEYDGSTSQTLAQYLEDLVQATGSFQSVNNASTLVTAGINTGL
jgi:L-2-hydroxyglutarate oxidase LhgO